MAPGLPSELSSEQRARMMFESASAMWPESRRFGRPARVALVAASVTSLFATTTALAAASVLPPSAARVVDGALHKVGINVSPPPSHPSHAASLAPPATAGAGPIVVAKSGSGVPGPVPTAACHGGLASGAASTGTPATAGTGSCTPAAAAAAVGRALTGTNETTELEKYRKALEEASPADRVGGFMTATTSAGSVNTGTGTRTGGSGGGKQGSGSGGGLGVGGNRAAIKGPAVVQEPDALREPVMPGSVDRGRALPGPVVRGPAIAQGSVVLDRWYSDRWYWDRW